jgi:hypothetical protein
MAGKAPMNLCPQSMKRVVKEKTFRKNNKFLTQTYLFYRDISKGKSQVSK